MDKTFVLDKKYFVLDKIISPRTYLILSRTKNILSGQMDGAQVFRPEKVLEHTQYCPRQISSKNSKYKGLTPPLPLPSPSPSPFSDFKDLEYHSRSKTKFQILPLLITIMWLLIEELWICYSMCSLMVVVSVVLLYAIYVVLQPGFPNRRML